MFEEQAIIQAFVKYGYFLSIIIIVLLMALEYVRPLREASVALSKRWCTNFLLYVSSQIFSKLVTPLWITSLAMLAQYWDSGIFRISNMPVIIGGIISLLLLDLKAYWLHRLMHQISWCWRFHKVHHSDVNFDVTTGLRVHPFDYVLQSLSTITLVFAIGIPPVALIIWYVLLSLINPLTHGNIRFGHQFKAIIQWVFITPSLHRIHHSKLSVEGNSNFGVVFSFWDRGFGSITTAPVVPVNKMDTGLSEYRDSDKLGVSTLLVMPFNR